MARARNFADVTACRAVSNPASEKYHVSLLSILGHYFYVVSAGKALYPHMPLDSGLNEYLVGQRSQYVRVVPSAEMAAIANAPINGVEMVHEWAGPVTRGIMGLGIGLFQQ